MSVFASQSDIFEFERYGAKRLGHIPLQQAHYQPSPFLDALLKVDPSLAEALHQDEVQRAIRGKWRPWNAPKHPIAAAAAAPPVTSVPSDAMAMTFSVSGTACSARALPYMTRGQAMARHDRRNIGRRDEQKEQEEAKGEDEQQAREHAQQHPQSAE